MPPKRARKAPAKKERAASSHSAADPVPSSSSSSSSSSSLSSSPHTTATAAPSAPHARRSPSPSPAPQKKKPQGTTAAATARSSPASSWWCYGLALVFILAAIGYASIAGGHSSRPHHPCACASAAAAANPLAKALLSRRSGVSGVHWQPEGGASRWLDKAALCSDVRVVELSRRYTAVPQLRQDLIKAFENDRSQCVVWVTAPDAVKAVANSLKELLENNALGGVTVVPPHARGTLVVKSAQSREALKEALPHRVVHMLTTLT